MEVQRPTHSVKPFHFRKYSTLPFKTLRRMILSTANSCTTAVSSVFLCLAVCFFLILPSMTNTGAAGHERIPNRLQAFVRTRHWRKEIARFGVQFGCAQETWQQGSGAITRTHAPAASPAVPTLLYCSSNPHILTPFNACTCPITTESSVGLELSCANNRKETRWSEHCARTLSLFTGPPWTDAQPRCCSQPVAGYHSSVCTHAALGAVFSANATMAALTWAR